MKRRTLTELTPTTKARMRDYVSRNRTVKTVELADDLNLFPTTVSAMKAWATRNEQ